MRRTWKSAVLSLAALLPLAGICWAQAPQTLPGAQQPNANRADANFGEPEVLEAGPVHEAFAEGVTLEMTEPMIVDREPPEPINEVPPEVRPEGANVEWIPGYWDFDGTREDFVWVSGVWRVIPPDRQWVPGHWARAEDGFQRVPGLWTTAGAEQLSYLPEPPASLEEGPSSPAPGENYFWVPGCWQWQDNDYAWRAGYWYEGQPNWVYVPSYYQRTPRGYLHVNGYWDYPVANRGYLYAPVYWPGGRYPGAGFAYRPNNILNTSLLLTSLFIGPQRGYYYGNQGYFGNYPGYSPWLGGNRGYGRGGYDPLFAYYQWNYGHNRNNWQNDFRRDYRDGRGPWNDGRGQWNDGRGNDGRRNDGRGPNRGGANDVASQLIRDAQQVARNPLGALGVANVNQQQRDQASRRAQQYRDFSRTRAEAELNGNAGQQANRGNRGVDGVNPRGEAGVRGDARGNARASQGFQPGTVTIPQSLRGIGGNAQSTAQQTARDAVRRSQDALPGSNAQPQVRGYRGAPGGQPQIGGQGQPNPQRRQGLPGVEGQPRPSLPGQPQLGGQGRPGAQPQQGLPGFQPSPRQPFGQPQVGGQGRPGVQPQQGNPGFRGQPSQPRSGGQPMPGNRGGSGNRGGGGPSISVPGAGSINVGGGGNRGGGGGGGNRGSAGGGNRGGGGGGGGGGGNRGGNR